MTTTSRDNPPTLESSILPKLRPFQREAFEFAVRGKIYDRQLNDDSAQNQQYGTAGASRDPSLLGKGRILLADEMGLG